MTSPRSRLALFRRVLLCLATVATVGSVAAACSAQPSTSTPVQHGATSQLSGSDVYLISCARCHGDAREGKTDAPALGEVRIASLGEQPLRFTIQFGKGRMPAFAALSPERVDALIAFLRGT